MCLPMGVQINVRSVERVLGSDEKVSDFVGEILAPKSEKKMSVCWKPSMNLVAWGR